MWLVMLVRRNKIGIDSLHKHRISPDLEGFFVRNSWRHWSQISPSVSIQIQRPREPSCFKDRERPSVTHFTFFFLSSSYVRRKDLQLFLLHDTDGADRHTLCSVIGWELQVQYPHNNTHNSGKIRGRWGICGSRAETCSSSVKSP